MSGPLAWRALSCLLAFAPLAAQGGGGQPPRGDTGKDPGKADPEPAWDDLARLAAGSTHVVMGVLEGSSAALDRATRGGGDYVGLRVAVREAMKQPAGGDVLDKAVAFRFYAAPRARNPHGFRPDLETVRDLLRQPAEKRVVIAFLAPTGGHVYLTDRFGVALMQPDRDKVVRVRRLLVRHRKLLATPLPVGDAALDARVEDLVRSLDRDAKTQAQALRALEDLGDAAVPAIVRHMDDRRELAEAAITLRNRAADRFEAYRRYSPGLVVDALAAVLNQITGERFGLDYSKATDPDRAQEIAGWRIYAHEQLARRKG